MAKRWPTVVIPISFRSSWPMMQSTSPVRLCSTVGMRCQWSDGNNDEKPLTFNLGLVLGEAEVRKKEMDVVLIPS